jgi:hypothetical protein
MMINAADAEEYTQALGQITAGAWRQILLAERLGVPDALGLSTREWVEQRLGGYVRLSVPERREAVAELTAEGLTTRETADVLGISKSQVAEDRKPELVQEWTEEPEEAEVEEAPPAEPVQEWTEPADENERLDQMAGQVDDGSIARARLLRDFHAGCRAFTRDLLPLDTDALGEALTDESDRYAVESLTHQMRDWLDQLDRALHGLKVIEGGRA